MDLFDYMRENKQEKESPLASRMRPTTLDEVVGQQHIIGKDKLLYRAIKADKLGSIIFYGPPGTGKTTTIKACTGILNFEEGDILIDGVSIKEKPLECKKQMAYIPDNPDMYDFMTGIGYLNFIADIFDVPEEVRDELIDKYADAFEIKDNLGQLISEYSHGMKPKLVIMDEPFVGLDPKASHILKQMMRKMCDDGGAIFFSTHVLEVAEKLCDKVAIIKGGRLVKAGIMEQVKGDESLESVFLDLEGES